MTWADLYLFCFLVGFFFSLLAAATGRLHLHFGHGHGAGFHLHAAGRGVHAGRGGVASGLNLGTVAAFLAWFGGTGFLVTQYYGVWFVTTLVLAIGVGLAGAGIVFWFLSRVLMRAPEELDPADYELVGTLGTVTSAIRPGGIGEILFAQAGVRHALPARSETGDAVARGTEVVVTRYENGVAWVRRWQELAEHAATVLH
ncbi:MAG TPA: NfeD family protein [Bryobacteraceae bacterium]|nr:NfeD family protein [Bryobacteraceae bacterium]